MKKQYLILVYDLEDRVTTLTWCKSNDELANLLLSIDEKQYLIADISVIDAIEEDPREFFRKEPKLETGGETR